MKVSGVYEQSYIQVNISRVERTKLHQHGGFRLFVSLPVKTMAVIPTLRRSLTIIFPTSQTKSSSDSSKLKSSSSENHLCIHITC
jgi:hypothetical protein